MYQHSMNAGPFIDYYVTEFKTVFLSFLFWGIFGLMILHRKSAKLKYTPIKVLYSTNESDLKNRTYHMTSLLRVK